VPWYVLSLLVALSCSRQGRRWLIERVPRLSPTALGLYRIALALALWMAMRRGFNSSGHLAIASVVLTTFGVGLAAQGSFAAFVYVLTVDRGGYIGHDLALPIKTLWLMILVPWGAGLSVDECLRRRFLGRMNVVDSRCYGLAVWIPMMMLGLAYAAAAFAKLDEAGLAWLRGGVRYAFLADASLAPVRLGRVIAGSDLLTALFSSCAIAAESVVIAGAISRRQIIILAAGAAALAMQIGFYVFQGQWWILWWALLLAFLPWQSIALPVTAAAARLHVMRMPTWDSIAGAERRIPAVVALVLLLAVAQQPVVSLLRREYSFVFSDFPMYSKVHVASKPDFAAWAEDNWQPPLIVQFRLRDGTVVDAQIRGRDPDGILIGAARTLARGAHLTEGEARTVRLAIAGLRDELSQELVLIFGDTSRFDWSAIDFVPRRKWRQIGRIDVAAGTIQRSEPDGR
jgi:hypothetical protein